MPATVCKDTPLETPSTTRLVIRVKLVPATPPPPAAARHLSKSALLLIVGAVAVLLSWLAISTFNTDPPLPSVASAPKPATEAIATSSAAATSVEPEVRPPPEPPIAAVNEVIPDVPQSALDTIRGTIRVAVRVIIDKQGAVIETVTEDRGPSRYFERLSVDASKQWTFTPAAATERRAKLLRFNFTRYGATAQASPEALDPEPGARSSR